MASLESVIKEDTTPYVISNITLCIDNKMEIPVTGIYVSASLSDSRIGGSACSVTVIPILDKSEKAANSFDMSVADANFKSIPIEHTASVKMTVANEDVVLYRGVIINTRSAFSTNSTSFKKTYTVLLGHPAAVIAAHHVSEPFMWSNKNEPFKLKSIAERLTAVAGDIGKLTEEFKNGSGFNVVAYLVSILSKEAKIIGDSGNVDIAAIVDVDNAPILNSTLDIKTATGVPMKNQLIDLVSKSMLKNSEWTTLTTILEQFSLLAVPTMSFGKSDKDTAIIPNIALGEASIDLKASDILSYDQMPPTRAADRKRAIAVYIDAYTQGDDSNQFAVCVQGYDKDGKPTLDEGFVSAASVGSDSKDNTYSNKFTIKTLDGKSKEFTIPLTRINLPDWIKVPSKIENNDIPSYVDFRRKVASIFARTAYATGLVKTGSITLRLPISVMLDKVRVGLGKVVKACLDNDETVYGQLTNIRYSIEADSSNFRIQAEATLSTIRNEAEQAAWSISSSSKSSKAGSDLLFIPQDDKNK